ncbi:MAG: sugar phosphate nucleotidyltransferase [Terracidiphilus sp.]
MSSPTLLVLAAGMGSRLGGLKVADPVGPGGETILDYSLYDALRAGFGRVVFVLRREIDKPFRELVAAHSGKRIAADYVYQEITRLPTGFRVPTGRTRPWGTTHAILSAASVLREPFAVVNVGDFYGAQSFRTLAQHLTAASSDYAMMGYVLRNTLSEFGSVARGICQVSEAGMLEKIQELKNIEKVKGRAMWTGADGTENRLTGDETVSMNMWGFTPAVFKGLAERFEAFLHATGESLDAECYIPVTVNEVLEAGQARVRVLRSVDSWFGVTYREDHPQAVEKIRHLIEAGHYPRKLW